MAGGKYTITGVLGSGSNATAYKAVTGEGREVAVKALSLKAMRGEQRRCRQRVLRRRADHVAEATH